MNYNWSTYTVLVAEDDPINFRYIELLLNKRTGINIIWAKDGKEAIESQKKNPQIDIILLDLQLPEMDGLSVLGKIKSQNPYLPIIIQTANSWNDERQACEQAGCDGFFAKPLNINALLKFMENCMITYSANKTLNISA